MKVLAIGAHFDDVELGCGGTLLKHQENGDEIHILVVTHSEYENKSCNFIRTRDEARDEGERSARILGATLHSMDLEPLVLVPTEKMVLQIEDLVNKIKPDRVYTHSPTDNHADHAAVGYVSVRACRKCKAILLYRSNWYIIDVPDNDNYYVDITNQLSKKEDLLSLFKSEMRKCNNSWINFVKQQNKAAGLKIGSGYAETFSVIKMVW
jgi:LmbE family N-acetylglucosaminyl deacetylase